MNVTYEGNSTKGTNEWLTPPDLLQKLGHFDLDPCSPIVRPWPTADKHYTIEDDGLRQPWFGRVFCNPPYDTKLIWKFMERCIQHKNVIALTFARTDTKLFQKLVFPNMHGILFIEGRLSFYKVNGERSGTAGAPSCLISFNNENTNALLQSGINGHMFTREHILG